MAADLSWCTAVLTRTRRQDGTAAGGTEVSGDQRQQASAGVTGAEPPSPDRPASDTARLVGAAPGGEG